VAGECGRNPRMRAFGPRSKGKDSSPPLKENPEFCIECTGSISREATEFLQVLAAYPPLPSFCFAVNFNAYPCSCGVLTTRYYGLLLLVGSRDPGICIFIFIFVANWVPRSSSP
jgi:hypothetical protein